MTPMVLNREKNGLLNYTNLKVLLYLGAPCPPLTLPNTNATVLNLTHGETAPVMCNAGYHLNGSSNLFHVNCSSNSSGMVWEYDATCTSKYSNFMLHVHVYNLVPIMHMYDNNVHVLTIWNNGPGVLYT